MSHELAVWSPHLFDTFRSFIMNTSCNIEPARLVQHSRRHWPPLPRQWIELILWTEFYTHAIRFNSFMWIHTWFIMHYTTSPKSARSNWVLTMTLNFSCRRHGSREKWMNPTPTSVVNFIEYLEDELQWFYMLNGSIMPSGSGHSCYSPSNLRNIGIYPMNWRTLTRVIGIMQRYSYCRHGCSTRCFGRRNYTVINFLEHLQSELWWFYGLNRTLMPSGSVHSCKFLKIYEITYYMPWIGILICGSKRWGSMVFTGNIGLWGTKLNKETIASSISSNTSRTIRRLMEDHCSDENHCRHHNELFEL